MENETTALDNELNRTSAEVAATADATLDDRDGGTGIAAHPDCHSAYKSVPAQAKRRAFVMLGAAAVTLVVIGLSRLLWLMEPVYDLIYYGVLSELVYYGILAILFTGYIVGLHYFLKRMCGLRMFVPRKSSVAPWRAFAVIAVGAVVVFAVSATLGFTLKLQREMGMGGTATTMIINIMVCFYYSLHLWLGFTAAALVQRACSILVPTRYTVPWGSVFLVAVYGVLELLFETYTTTHMFPWVYFIFTFAYAAIFALTGRSFHLSYWASVMILVL